MKRIKFLIVVFAVFAALNCEGQGRPAIEYHNPSITYDVNDLVVKDGTIYRALNATSDTPPTANWAAQGGAEADPVYTADYWLIRRFDEDVVLGGTVAQWDILKPSPTDGRYVKASALDADAGKTRYVFATQNGVAGDTIRTYNSASHKGNNTLTYGDPVYLGDDGRPTTTLPTGTPVQIGVVEYDWSGFWADTDKFYSIDFNRNYSSGGSGGFANPATADLDMADNSIGTVNTINTYTAGIAELYIYENPAGQAWANTDFVTLSMGMPNAPGGNANTWNMFANAGTPYFDMRSADNFPTRLSGRWILNRSTAQLTAEASDSTLVHRAWVEDYVANNAGGGFANPATADLDMDDFSIYGNPGMGNYVDMDNVYAREFIAYDAGGYAYANFQLQGATGSERLSLNWSPGNSFFNIDIDGTYYANFNGDFRLNKTTANIDAGNALGLVNRQYVVDKLAAAGSITDHTQLTSIGTNTHAQIDSHIADATTHYTQGAISITESQISDLAHTVDTDTQLSQAQVGAYAEAEGFLKDTATNINLDTISANGNELKVLSSASYPGLWLGSTSATWGGTANNWFARMELGYGKIDIDGNFYYAADPQPTWITFSPGTGSWFLGVRENEAGDGGARANWVTKEITAASYTMLWDVSDAEDSDEGVVFFGNSATAQTFTLPDAGPLGTWSRDGWNVTIFQKGAGQITIAPDTGDTLNVPAGYDAKTSGQFAAVTVVYQDGEFYITGSLATTP